MVGSSRSPESRSKRIPVVFGIIGEGVEGFLALEVACNYPKRMVVGTTTHSNGELDMTRQRGSTRASMRRSRLIVDRTR